MKRIKKSVLIFGVFMALCVAAYAQASCTMIARAQVGGYRVTTWSCNDGMHTDVSYYSNGSWHQL
jgi:hypothetical protein